MNKSNDVLQVLVTILKVGGGNNPKMQNLWKTKESMLHTCSLEDTAQQSTYTATAEVELSEAL